MNEIGYIVTIARNTLRRFTLANPDKNNKINTRSGANLRTYHSKITDRHHFLWFLWQIRAPPIDLEGQLDCDLLHGDSHYISMKTDVEGQYNIEIPRPNGPSVYVIGAGLAGLCAAVSYPHSL